jgi:hypothetical protein
MKLEPSVIEAVKAKQMSEILSAHKLSRATFDLDKALAGAQPRLLKGIELTEQGVVFPFAGKHCSFIVGEYFVTTEGLIVGCDCPSEVHCQCEDHRHRKGRCKHILAAGLFVRHSRAEKASCNV